MNLSNELLLLLQGGAGAVSGYITNKYAVNMLFKEYTPFKLFNKVIIPLKFGGVIKNRKKEFIEEISALVERDIINSNTIISNLKDEKFDKVLNEIIKNFYNKELTNSFDEMKFNDIYGFEDIINKISNEFSNLLKNDINIIDTIIDKINLNDELTYKFINNISEGLYKGIVNEVSNNNVLSSSLKKLYNTISNIKINEVVSQNQIELIKSNLTESIKISIDDLFENDKKLNEVLDNIYEEINIKDIFNKVQDLVYDKKIGDYITEAECEYISIKICDLLSSYINSEDGQNNFNNIAHFILNIIKDMNYTTYDLIPNDSKEILTDFINKNIHKIIPYFSEWIRKNKDNFDLIIEKSIDEAIVNMDDGIKKIITSKVRELFLDNISAKNEVVEKIIKYIEEYNLDDNSLNEISSTVLNYLKNTKISEIYIDIQESNLVNHSFIEKILDFFKIQFNMNGQKMILNLLKSQLSKSVGDIIQKDLYNIFIDNIKGLINNYLILNKENLREILKRSINNIIEENIELIQNNRIGNYFEYSLIENNMIKINTSISSILDKNKETIIKSMTIFMNEKLSKIKNDNSIKEKIISNVVDNIKLNIIEKGTIKISNVILNDFCKDEVYLATTKITREILEDNLDSLLRGKIKETIKNNLSQYNENEICDLAQRFMGNELKPLSLFGGILGFITGIIFGAFSRNIGINGFYNNISEQILSIILMGGVGVFTNIIAINMLFKPYTKNKLLAKIPFIKNFSLGYIPAHKNNISAGIGSVIDNDLLNSSYIKNLLSKYRENLKTKLLKSLGSNNCKLISDFLTSHKEKIKISIKTPLVNLIITNKNKIAKNITLYTKNIKIDDSKLNKDIINKIIESSCVEQKIKDISIDYMNNCINSSSNIYDIIYPELKYKIEIYLQSSMMKPINKLSDSIKNLNMNNDVISKYIYNSIKDKDLASQLIDNTSLYIGKNSLNVIQKLLSENLNKFIDMIVYEENTVETVFNGKMKIYIDKNLYSLTNFIVDKVKILLINNEDFINDNIKQKINESLNFFEKIGYAMAGGDSIVDNAVSIMVEKNLPEFISERFFEITDILKESLDNNIYKLKIKDICPNMNTVNINILITSVFEILNKDEVIINNCANITNDLINSSIDLIDENNISSILHRFNDEINLILLELSDNILLNQTDIGDIFYNLLIDYILKSVYDMKIKNIFEDYNNEDLSITINKFFNKTNINNFIKEESILVLSRYINNKSISDIIYVSKNEEYINKKFNELFNSEEIKMIFEQILCKLSDSILENIVDEIDYETKIQIIDKLLDASLNSAINNAKEIIDSLDLKEITKNQIEIMNPKELHMLFLSFAGSLFKKIYLYGIYGAIFGINLWIPVIFGLKEGISSIKSSNDVIEDSKNTL